MAKSKDVKECKNLICEECDSEYKLTYIKNMVSGLPECCAFCGSPIDLESEEDSDDDEDAEESDEW